jgi:hypothetical protein
MEINNSNYFDVKMMSVSTFKNFVGTVGLQGCEYSALAKWNGKYKQEPNNAMLIGSYVDNYFSNELEYFKQKNPSIFTQTGSLKADFKKAEEIIESCKNDKLFYSYITGEQQVIMTAELFGMIWKIKIDSLHKGKCIVDLKTTKSIKELLWSDKMRIKVNFIDYYGYIEQMAIYQKVYEKNTGEKLPMFIAAITKESVPDKEIIEIPQELLDEKIDYIAEHIVRVKNIIDGKTEPEKCGVCDYCRENKKLSKTISYFELI